MKNSRLFSLLAIWLLASFSCTSVRNSGVDLKSTKWEHGSADCRSNEELPIQVVQLDGSTWLLRQNKCIHYEAPFLFLFIGRDKALLMDTGATETEDKFPLYATVKNLVDGWQQRNGKTVELVVAHTHAHRDHIAGDGQFRGKPMTTVVGTGVGDVTAFFRFQNWPGETASFDLGGRKLQLIPIPGHEAASIAVYDPQTKILLSGDSFYPGRLYVKDWHAYRESMQRLGRFADTHRVSDILGNHIEMTNTPGKDYPVGTTYQPNEHPLPLTRKQLSELNTALQRIGETPAREVHNDFIIDPK